LVEEVGCSSAMVEADGGVDALAGAPPYVEAATEPFEVFFAREYRKLVALGRALTGDRSVAEDLAQDALWATQRRWARVGRMDDPAAWARRVVANRAASRWRHLAVEARALARLPRRAHVEPTDGPETFWAAVRSLPPR
jgi:RNA polymerase sigma-70 factor (ECF subfamily)